MWCVHTISDIYKTVLVFCVPQWWRGAEVGFEANLLFNLWTLYVTANSANYELRSLFMRFRYIDPRETDWPAIILYYTRWDWSSRCSSLLNQGSGMCRLLQRGQGGRVQGDNAQGGVRSADIEQVIANQRQLTLTLTDMRYAELFSASPTSISLFLVYQSFRVPSDKNRFRFVHNVIVLCDDIWFFTGRQFGEWMNDDSHHSSNFTSNNSI